MQRPKVTMIMAMSADGFITKHEDGLVDWTSKEDKQHFSSLTKKMGVLIYGNSTFKTFNKPLPGRLNIVLTRTPENSEPIPGTLEFTNASPKEILDDLADRGFSEAALTGGGHINSLFLKEGLVDEVILTIEPHLFASGKCLFSEMKADIQLRLLNMEKLNDDAVVLHYQVQRYADQNSSH